MGRFLCGLLLAGLAFPAMADLRREVEPNQPAAAAQPVVPPASMGGAIQAPGDADLYTVRLEAGQTIQADVLARGFRADQNPGSLLTAVLELLDTDGTSVLARVDSQGGFDDPSLTFQVPTSGRYFVSVRNLDFSAGGIDYRYILSLEVGANDSFELATPILPGQMFYYLVSGRNACREGTLGSTSSVGARPIPSPCP